MTRRLVVMCFMTTCLLGLASSPVQTQDVWATSLKGIDAIFVLVEDLPDGARTLSLTKEAIQTDVELKLRLAGMHVVTKEEGIKLPGSPYLYVNVNADSRAAIIRVELAQDVRLERTGERVPGVPTWRATGTNLLNPTAQGIRNSVKDSVDAFLNAWLSVNPKK